MVRSDQGTANVVQSLFFFIWQERFGRIDVCRVDPQQIPDRVAVLKPIETPINGFAIRTISAS